MPDHPQLDAPMTLTGLFPADDNDDEPDTAPVYEIQTLEIAGLSVKVRQFDYHSHNANRVWPGTFNLAEYLVECGVTLGDTLELGTATGVLAMILTQAQCCRSLTTSDVEDEHGEIAENLAYNYCLNAISAPPPPPHVPHTWGTDWARSVSQAGVDVPNRFDSIVASDILLYVAAYPALVETLQQVMSESTVLIMSWNRRMKESAAFFQLMDEAGFDCHHQGKCIYRLTRQPAR